METRQACKAAAALIRDAGRIVVFTGAGVSTESGIPDFRSPGGIWDRYDPRELTFDRFLVRAEVRRDYWKLATETYPLLRDATPNAAHRGIAALERAGRLQKLVTQNIDGLHQKAGNSEERTIEIHGSALKARCVNCGVGYDRATLHEEFVAGREDCPECSRCGGFVKPATISFGQAMPEPETSDAFEAARRSDLVVVIGSSLVVYPAAGVPEEAVRAGAPMVIINREATGQDGAAEVVVRGDAASCMAEILDQAGVG